MLIPNQVMLKYGGVISSSDDISEVPQVPLAKFLLDELQKALPRCGSRPWVIDARSGTSVKFDEIEDQSRRIASALHKLGFRRGHVLFFVTYEMAQLYLIQLAVWRLGGAVRGSYQKETPAEYARQMVESHAEFALVSAETATKVQEAVSLLDWPVQLLSCGTTSVKGTTSFTELILDDGEAFPDELQVNVHDDVAIIPNTSGSTGKSKGVLLTHFTVVATLQTRDRSTLSKGQIMMLPMNNFSILHYIMTLYCLVHEITAVHLGRFEPDTYFQSLKKYKPSSTIMYPYIASWLIRHPKIKNSDLSFLKFIVIGGSVLDPTTVKMFATQYPKIKLKQIYGMSECSIVTSTAVYQKSYGCLPMAENGGEVFVSSGTPLSYIQIKVVDVETGIPLGPGERGEILIKSPLIMRGYLRKDSPPVRSIVNKNGWMFSGDIGFYDDFRNIYIVDRKSFFFKYNTNLVSPSVVENVLTEHEAVHGAGVVGVPHLESTNLTRAYIVLRPGCSVRAEVLQTLVESRLPEHMHLHGGVRFLQELLHNRGGKLDRMSLRQLALIDNITSLIDSIMQHIISIL